MKRIILFGLLFISLLGVASAANVYMLSGHRYSGDFTLDPLIKVGSNLLYEEDLQNTTSNFKAIFYDENNVIKTFYFDVDKMEIPDGGILETFFFFSVVPDGTKKIVFEENNLPIYEYSFSSNVPVVQNINVSEEGEYFDVSWSAYDIDKDNLTYDLYYGYGENWRFLAMDLNETNQKIPSFGFPEGNVVFKVVASDGFNTGERISDPVYTPNKAPIASIIYPIENSPYSEKVSNGSIYVIGGAYDPEEGFVNDSDLLWKVDGNVWAHGREFNIYPDELTKGRHTITVEADDSDENIGTDSRNITIGLINHFRFDNLDESISGYGHKSRLFGNSELGIGVSGKALILDGSGDYAYGDYMNDFGVGDRTVSVWVKTTDRKGDIYSRLYTPYNDLGCGYALGIEDGNLALRIGKGIYTHVEDGLGSGGIEVDSVVSDIPISDNSWHHVVMVLNEDNKNWSSSADFYVDGSYSGSVSSQEICDELSYESRAYVGYTGNDIMDNVGGYLGGIIDEVSEYDYALSESEISKLYDSYGNDWCNGADINQNGEVKMEDLSVLLSNWGKDDCSENDVWCNGADINQNGEVKMEDLSVLLSGWGKSDCRG